MAQLSIICSVTNGSQTVVVPGKDLSGQITRNHIFLQKGDLTPYFVKEATYSEGSTVITLTGNFQGGTTAYADCVVAIDATYPDQIPLINRNDIGTAEIFKAAMYRIQEMISAVDPTGLGQYAEMYSEVLSKYAELNLAKQAFDDDYRDFTSNYKIFSAFAAQIESIREEISQSREFVESSVAELNDLRETVSESAEFVGKASLSVNRALEDVTDLNSKVQVATEQVETHHREAKEASEIAVQAAKESADLCDQTLKASHSALQSSIVATQAEKSALSHANEVNLSLIHVKQSEEQARLSEVAAKSSQEQAQRSEINAQASESAVKVSQYEAQKSEKAARASEEAARALENSSRSLEAITKASRMAAKTSENEARLSEEAAKKSEQAAKKSEEAAKKSELAAEGFALGTSASERAAKDSELLAKASELQAKQSEIEAKASEIASARHNKQVEQTAITVLALEVEANKSADSAKESQSLAAQHAAAARADREATEVAERKAKQASAAARQSELTALSSKEAVLQSEKVVLESVARAVDSQEKAHASSELAKKSESHASSAERSAARLLASFLDLYLGEHDFDPTVSHDDKPLRVGQLYFNTQANAMRTFNGEYWTAAYITASGMLTAAANLSDIPNPEIARNNLRLGSIAVEDAESFVRSATLGQPNGAATLDSKGKVPLHQISDAILGQVEYMGAWDPIANLPALAQEPGRKGQFYIASNAGKAFGLFFDKGDWIISNGIAWEKIQNTDAVKSVNGRIGAVVVTPEDIGVEPGAQVNTVHSINGRQGHVKGLVEDTDERLNNSREWIAQKVSRAEAEAGVSTVARKWTSERVRQAVMAVISAIGNATTTAAGWMSPEDKVKLNEIQSHATKNKTDDWLVDRRNHTGTQKLDSIEGLGEVLGSLSSDISLLSLSATEKANEIQEELSKKQDALVSGKHLKTVNGQSILGSGNIHITHGDPESIRKLRMNALLGLGM